MNSKIEIKRKGFEPDTINIFEVIYSPDQVEVEYIGKQDERGENISKVILITDDSNNLFQNNKYEINARIKAHYESPNSRGQINVL